MTNGKMPLTEFTCFMKLPYDLRYEIYRTAMRPTSPGVHRVSFKETPKDPHAPGWRQDYTSLPYYVDKQYGAIPSNGEAGEERGAAGEDEGSRSLWAPGNKSMYCWDGALWDVSRETREFMTLRYRDKFKRLLAQPPPQGLMTDDEKALYNRLSLSMLVGHYRGETWHMMTRPRIDLFCLEPADWEATIDCNVVSEVAPFHSKAMWLPAATNFALEFDASWLQDLPISLAALLREPSPRGFAARTIKAMVRNWLDGTLWLIDRKTDYSALVESQPEDGQPDGEQTAEDESAEEEGVEEEEVEEEIEGWPAEEDPAEEEPIKEWVPRVFLDCQDTYTEVNFALASQNSGSTEAKVSAANFIACLVSLDNETRPQQFMTEVDDEVVNASYFAKVLSTSPFGR